MGRLSSRSIWRLQRLLSVGNLDDVILYNAADLLPWDLDELGFNTSKIYEARRAILFKAKRVVREPIKQLMLYDMQTYLQSLLNRNDRMTMAASIECRVPFLSIGVVEAALKLPTSSLFSGRYGKWILREHATNLLPLQVLRRPKWGLGIPWTQYLRSDPLCRDHLVRLPASEFGKFLQAPGLSAAIEAFLRGNDRKAPIVYQMFALSVWWEEVIMRRLSITSQYRQTAIQ
jgi:asparagine synthase (glutamine-hydrolysing)